MKAERVAGGGLVGVLGLLLLLNLIWVVGNCDRLRPPSRGDVAPGFVLQRADGRGTVSLAGLKGKVVLIDFWATWCGPCRATMPVIERLYEKYHQRGLALVSINTDGGAHPAGRALAFARRFGLTFPVYLDDGRVGVDYRVETIPHMVILDRSGRIRDVDVGLTSTRALQDKLEHTIQRLLAEPSR